MFKSTMNLGLIFVPLVIAGAAFHLGSTKFYGLYNPWMYERSVKNAVFTPRGSHTDKISLVPEIRAPKDETNQVLRLKCESHFPGDGDGKGVLSVDDEYCVKQRIVDVATRYNTYHEVQNDKKLFDPFSFGAYGQMYDALYKFLNDPNRNADDVVTVQGRPLKIRAILQIPKPYYLKAGDKLLPKFDPFLLENLSKNPPV